MTQRPEVRSFFHAPTNTVSYLVFDVSTHEGALIDPVLDFELATGEVGVQFVERVLKAAAELGVRLAWTLETHAHADHLSASAYVRARTRARIGIGEHIRAVQRIFAPKFDAHDVTEADFDRLLADGERLALGELDIEVLHTPGHTPACVSFRIGDAVFVGDTLFMPDYGTARADFPGGDARQLYRSIRRLLDLPPKTRLYMCHDYKAPGRDAFAWETTVEAERAHNVQVHDGVSEDAYVAMRQARDAALAAPALLIPSIQVNIRAGRFPPPSAGGARFILIPVKTATPEAARAVELAA